MIWNSMLNFKGIRNNMKGTLQFVLLTHFMNLKIVLFWPILPNQCRYTEYTCWYCNMHCVTVYFLFMFLFDISIVVLNKSPIIDEKFPELDVSMTFKIELLMNSFLMNTISITWLVLLSSDNDDLTISDGLQEIVSRWQDTNPTQRCF